MPLVPTFRQVEQTVFSAHVSDLNVDIFGRVDSADVTVDD